MISQPTRSEPVQPTSGTSLYLPEVRRSNVSTRLDQVLWQMVGQCDFEFESGRRTVRTGQCLWLAAGTPHSFRMHAGGALLPIEVANAPGAVPFVGPTVLEVDADFGALLYAKVQQATSLIQRSVDLDRLIVRALSRQHVVHVSLPVPWLGPAAAVAEMLCANPADDRSVADLARAAHVSVRTLERAFRSQTGYTLQEWRTRNRMDAAADLLRRRVDVDAAAHRVGYLSVSAFRRAFKAQYGVTPSEFTQRTTAAR